MVTKTTFLWHSALCKGLTNYWVPKKFHHPSAHNFRVNFLTRILFLSYYQSRSRRHGEEKIFDPTGTRTPSPRSSSQLKNISHFLGVHTGRIKTIFPTLLVNENYEKIQTHCLCTMWERNSQSLFWRLHSGTICHTHNVQVISMLHPSMLQHVHVNCCNGSLNSVLQIVNMGRSSWLHTVFYVSP